MRNRHARWLLPATLASAMATAAAQSAAGSPAAGLSRPSADPLNPAVQVPALVYRSALPSHRRLLPEPALGWREANDQVQRIGGWRVYAREAQAPETSPSIATPPQAPTQPAAAAASMPTAQPMAAPHGGPHKH